MLHDSHVTAVSSRTSYQVPAVDLIVCVMVCMASVVTCGSACLPPTYIGATVVGGPPALDQLSEGSDTSSSSDADMDVE